MKTKIEQLYNDNKYLIIFLAAFTFYLCLGYSLNRMYQTGLNIYFGADNARAHRDLMLIEAENHSRVSVHPLMLILLQPITLLVNGIVNYPPATEVVTGSIACAICACCVYRILSHYLKKEWNRLFLTAVFVCTFSNMIFATVPETFMYSGMFLLLFWSYVLEKVREKTPIGKYDYVLLCFFGIASFGITLTNYMSYTIGLLGILWACETGIGKRIGRFVGINACNLSIIAILSKIQQYTWGKELPFFGDSIFALFAENKENSEAYYMNFEISLQKLVKEFQLVFTNGLFGDRIVRRDLPGRWDVFFDTPGLMTTLISILFVVGVLLSIILGIRNKHVKVETTLLSAVLISNLCLHYIYGYDEAFIYTPHYLWTTFIIIAIGVHCINESLASTMPLVGLLAVELFMNLMTYRRLISIVTGAIGRSDSGVLLSMMKTLVVCVILSLAIFIGKHVVSGNITLKRVITAKRACMAVYLYGMLVFVTVVSIFARSIIE